MKVHKRVIETETIETKKVEEPPTETPKVTFTSNSGSSQNYRATFLGQIETTYPDRLPCARYNIGDVVMIGYTTYSCVAAGITDTTPYRAPNHDILIDGTVAWQRINEFTGRSIIEMIHTVFAPYMGTSCVLGTVFLLQGEEVGTVDFNGTLHVDPNKLPLIRRIYEHMKQGQDQMMRFCYPALNG